MFTLLTLYLMYKYKIKEFMILLPFALLLFDRFFFLLFYNIYWK